MAAPEIIPERTWVTADSHFGHRNIIGFCDRPEDHEQRMMEAWAREVPEDATVLHLGDLAYRNNAFFKNMIAPHLTGERKLLVRGNHDHQRFSFYRQSGFKLIRPFTLRWGETKTPTGKVTPYQVSFSHYPWNSEEEGPQPAWSVRLHGHIHNNGYTRDAFVPFLRNHINVSVEQTHYRPVNLQLLLEGVLEGRLPGPIEQRERDE